MISKCPVCDGSGFSPQFRQLQRCLNCGFVTAETGLSDEQCRGLYGEDYFSGGEYANYLADERALRLNFERRLRTLARFSDPSRHGRLLEIGCAYGFFLDIARGSFGSVTGIDVSEGGVRYARERFGLRAVHADFLEHDFAGETFDVACMWDTIEHLRRPGDYIEKVGSLTGPGAVLALTTGDMGSLNARLRGEKWRLIHPPTHLHYFNRDTIARLLGRHGFRVVYCRPCGFYRSIDNAAYNILVLRKKRPAVYSFLKRKGLLDMVFYLNLYDIMYVIARKED